MTHKIQDLNRRNLSFSRSKIREVLPEYFVESYPNLVLFLEKYYSYLEDENADSFKREINNLFVSRDPEQVDEQKLDYLLEEIGNGLKSSSFFDNPRLMTALLSRFYRVKGSLASIEGFFRGFYGQEVSIEYPKNKMFIVGESEVGYESLKYIQDNKLYQIFSILIKSAISTSTYNDLYLKFVHPAGFYYAGEVQLENSNIFGLQNFSQQNLRESAEPLILTSISEFGIVYEPNQLTGLYDSSGETFRIRLDDYIEAYKDLSPAQLSIYYSSFSQMLTPQSFTFDDSDRQDSALSAAPDFAMVIETMDNDLYTIRGDSQGDSFY